MQEGNPIIVRRVYKKAGHHGGAWKVAFADFAVAMMAFFLVMWLSASTTPEQKEAISGYFKDPTQFQTGTPYVIDLGGTPSSLQDESLSEVPDDEVTEVVSAEQIELLADEIERKRMQTLLEDFKQEMEASETLQEFKDQIILDITPEGLRIQIVDKTGRPMFDSGRSELKFYSEDVLFELAKIIAKAPNKLSIKGHTDATPFKGREDFTNWELSSERANSARRALVEGGVNAGKVSQVVGLAESVLYDQDNPTNPINRRISITLLYKQVEAEMKRRETGISEDPVNESGVEIIDEGNIISGPADRGSSSNSISEGLDFGDAVDTQPATDVPQPSANDSLQGIIEDIEPPPEADEEVIVF